MCFDIVGLLVVWPPRRTQGAFTFATVKATVPLEQLLNLSGLGLDVKVYVTINSNCDRVRNGYQAGIVFAWALAPKFGMK